MEHTLASYFAARDARVRAAMMLFNPMSVQVRRTANTGGAVLSGALGCLMLASLVMISSQVVGTGLFMVGCIFFCVGMEMLTRAGNLANEKLSSCFGIVDSEAHHPEFRAAMQKYVHQRIEEEWEPIIG